MSCKILLRELFHFFLESSSDHENWFVRKLRTPPGREMKELIGMIWTGPPTSHLGYYFGKNNDCIHQRNPWRASTARTRSDWWRHLPSFMTLIPGNAIMYGNLSQAECPLFSKLWKLWPNPNMKKYPPYTNTLNTQYSVRNDFGTAQYEYSMHDRRNFLTIPSYQPWAYSVVNKYFEASLLRSAW